MQKVRHEVETEIPDGAFSEGNIGKLKYCKQVLEETLRIKAPVPDLSRLALEDCKFYFFLCVNCKRTCQSLIVWIE